MRKELMMLLPVVTMLSGGCATSVPVAVECPLPPPPPQVVSKSVLDRAPLLPQLNSIESEFADSLKRAMKPK